MFENCSLVTSCGWLVKELLLHLVRHCNLLCFVKSTGQVSKWIRTCVSHVCVSYVAKSLRIRWEGRLCFFTWYSNSVDQPAVCVLGGGREEVLCLRNFVLPYSYFFIMKMLGTSWIIRTQSLVAFDSRERSTSASPVIIFADDLESMESGLAMTAFIFSLFLFKHIIQI